ncbi:dynamin family protein [Flavobacterium piscisymbiosum]|uniref:Dynamin family protein n=1 Tax=Flavobacterium piscisymbiosum TaxID=2893753 RepID=A0ABS8MDM2_9FLAO|nr:dynamin family protein [Flavobacterium sp. F-30]MCC9063602.1 dynamin family protein [Flavobacterium sp. F-30]
MNKNIEKLLFISESLGLNDIIIELKFIEQRSNEVNKELVIPIVGEFSSGKTTLINSLTHSKKLETASKPTTATVYEIHFECKRELVELFYSDGRIDIVDDISSFKNDQLDDVPLIKVYDTSNKISSTTILVDTPGLSSNNPRHIESLSKYLPNADALLLFIDVNQQITKSLLDFLTINSLTYLPLYLVVTKTDTKTSSEINDVRAYIAKTINLPLENIISISSVKNELEEFYSLMNNIQKNKNQIIDRVLNFRLENISKYLINHIEELIKNSSSDATLDNEVKSQKRTLEKLNFAIEKLISDTRCNLEDIGDAAKREFENHVSDKLDAIISKQDTNADSQAVGIINSTANITLSNYQDNVRKSLYLLANVRKSSDLEIPLRFLDSVDLSNVKMDSFEYNIDLSGAGQETVRNISIGLKIAAAVTAVAITAGAATAAIAPASVVSTGVVGTEAAITASTLVNVADTVTDVANIASNIRTQKGLLKFEKIGHYVEMTKSNISLVNDYNVKAGSMIGANKEQGFVESIVGNLTDGVLGKPQRKKMIDSYLESNLIPQFKSRMSNISSTLLSEIKNSLENEAAQKIAQMESNLLELQKLSKNEKELFTDRINQLKEFKSKLL